MHRALSAVTLVLALSNPFASTHAHAAPSVSQQSREAVARENRLAFGFGFGAASTSMSGFIADDLARSSEGQGLDVDGSPESSFGYAADLSAKYYFPKHILAELGYSAMYASASSRMSMGPASADLVGRNVVMEVPLLLGGHFAPTDRVYLEAGAGPSLHFFAKSYWTVEGGTGGTDLEAPSGFGAQAKLAANYMITDSFGLGVETRYRYLKTADLREIDSDTVITGAMLQLPESERTYQLNFSGISAMLRAQFLVF